MKMKSNSIYRLILASFLLVMATDAFSASNNAIEAYIAKYSPVAVMHQQKYGIPASISLAQGLLESRAGQSDLAVVARNHFGIKCHNTWQGKRFLMDDDLLGECFRHYDSVEESWEDHARFLKKKRYAVLFTLDVTDYKEWARGLKKCGYATDPAYAEKLIGVIERYELFLFDTNQPRIAAPEYLEGDETLEHSVENAILEEVNSIHQIKQRCGLYYVAARRGDTVEKLAAEFNIPVKELLKFNDLEDETVPLKSGDIIYLQEKNDETQAPSQFHIVGNGETLQSISQIYGLQLKALLRINKIKRNTPLRVGSELRLR